MCSCNRAETCARWARCTLLATAPRIRYLTPLHVTGSGSLESGSLPEQVWTRPKCVRFSTGEAVTPTICLTYVGSIQTVRLAQFVLNNDRTIHRYVKVKRPIAAPLTLCFALSVVGSVNNIYKLAYFVSLSTPLVHRILGIVPTYSKV